MGRLLMARGFRNIDGKPTGFQKGQNIGHKFNVGRKNSEETKTKRVISYKKYLLEHPEVKEKISCKQKEAWEKNPNRNMNIDGLKKGWEQAKLRKEEKNNRICPICNKNFYRRGNRKIEIMCCSKECAGINIRGESHHWWRNGKSREPYPLEWRLSLRELIRKRDQYTCQFCKIKQENRNFHVHHIDYKKNNLNPNNLITLCPSCHAKTSVQ